MTDYLYFLPRILEVTATEPPWWPDPEVTGRAIRSANPDSWSVERRTALSGYLEAVVAAAISDCDYYRLDSWVCATGRMGLDVRPYLEMISQSPAAVLGYFEVNAESLPRGRLPRPWPNSWGTTAWKWCRRCMCTWPTSTST